MSIFVCKRLGYLYGRLPLTLALLSLVSFCSCRSSGHKTSAVDVHDMEEAHHQTGDLPPQAYAGDPSQFGPQGAPHGMYDPTGRFPAGVPLAENSQGPWAPPGLAQPWPEDEYLVDGSDQGVPVGVKQNFQVDGLDVEDTVAHYDTVDGERVVEASNMVRIYAPRFGAVRTVSSIVQNEQIAAPAGIQFDEKIVQYDDADKSSEHRQNIGPRGQIGNKRAAGYRSKEGDGLISSALSPHGFEDHFKPYENLAIIKRGVYEQSEKGRLAQSADSAISWAADMTLHIILDDVVAGEMAGTKQTASVFTSDSPKGHKLRIHKVASSSSAQPGETVDFTIRFDNVGPTKIGNVTVMDNLTTRLEYVPESAQCSLKADFVTQPNEAGSLILRWEVTEPLKPGEGGIVRFQCRVR